jgi:hypothetical protein
MIETQSFMIVFTFINFLVKEYFKVNDNDKHFEEQLQKTKNTFCVMDCKTQNLESPIKFPCGCSICDYSCLYQYHNFLDVSTYTEYVCPCSYKYNIHQKIDLLETYASYNLVGQRNHFVKVIDIFLNTCMYCKGKAGEGSTTVKISDSVLTRYFSTVIPHKICSTCKYDEKAYCQICKVKHEKINI